MRMRSQLLIGATAATALSASVVGVIAAQTPEDDSPAVPSDDTQAESRLRICGTTAQIDEVAGLLGLAPTAVMQALAQGQTLAELAAEQGVDSQVIIDTLVANVAEKLDEAEADARIDAEGAEARLAQATERITAFVNDGEPLRAAYGRHERHGPRATFGLRGQLAEVAELLGVEPTDVSAALMGGETLADVATANGVDPDTVVATLVAETSVKLDDAVVNGRIDETQAATMLQQATEQITAFVYEGADAAPRFEGPRRHRQHARLGRLIGQSAAVIGVEPTAVAQALRDGTSIAEFAASQGVSEGTLISGLLADAEARLAAAVESGDHTQAEADAKLATLAERLADALNRVPGSDAESSSTDAAPAGSTTL